jgi:hypothetical protein
VPDQLVVLVVGATLSCHRDRGGGGGGREKERSTDLTDVDVVDQPVGLWMRLGRLHELLDCY